VTFVTPSKFRARAVDHLAVAIGTTKGLFFVSDGAIDGPFFAGEAVGAFAQLEGRLLAATRGLDQAPAVRWSDDGGLTWSAPAPGQFQAPASGDEPLAGIWQLHPDRRPSASGTIWAGGEPATLFRSSDRGEQFEPVTGLSEHPDRPSWKAGRGGLALHSIMTHPERPNRVVVAVSSGGVYRSDDDGQTWAARNEGIAARVLPDSPGAGLPNVHKLASDAVNPDFFWAQATSGVYKTTDAGEHWEPVSRKGQPAGLPSEFGFPIVAHPEEPATAYVVPLESGTYRCTVNGRCRVYRTMDAGLSWQALSDGLPSSNAYVTVLRDAFSVGAEPPYPLVFGSKSGHVFASLDSGDSWRLVASFLPPVLCIRVLS
jgi:photosystem II stability/assembly factor-like uncharacterized protein